MLFISVWFPSPPVHSEIITHLWRLLVLLSNSHVSASSVTRPLFVDVDLWYTDITQRAV